MAIAREEDGGNSKTSSESKSILIKAPAGRGREKVEGDYRNEMTIMSGAITMFPPLTGTASAK